jgi:hypothetical protein
MFPGKFVVTIAMPGRSIRCSEELEQLSRSTDHADTPADHDPYAAITS